MYAAKGVAITDGINRINHIMPVSTIMKAYADSYKTPMIINLGHDRSKPAGYTLLDGIYFEPGKAYLTNTSYFPDSEDENQILDRMVRIADEKMFYAEHQEEVKRLYDRLENFTSKDARVAPTGQAVAIIDKGIVGRVFPQLHELMQDRLIDIKELSPVYQKNLEADEDMEERILIPGVYRMGEFFLFAHPFCRRNLSVVNTINDSFFIAFEKLRKSELQLKIALDMDMIGLPGTESLELEYQYWWGPKFNEDLTSIPEGVTTHKNEHYDNLFSNITDTQFYWHIQDEINTFECEEICDKENVIENNEKYFVCRYVHSMVNKESGLPYHLDGAVRLYSDVQIIERMDANNDISKCGKNSMYHKLWRIDGEIAVSTWKELITHFFRDNFLIGEYFNGQDESYVQIKEEKDEKNEKNESQLLLTKSKYIPVEFHSGDGLRMYYKLSNKNEIPVERDAIVVNHWMITTTEGRKVKYLEADVITYLKLLISKGIRMRKPVSSLVDFGDMICNYPCISCSNKEIASIVLNAVLELCLVWKKKNDDRLLSLGLLINDEDKAIQVSFAGHIDDYIYVLQDIKLMDKESVEEWMQALYEKNNEFGQANNYPDKYQLLNDGTLHFERIFVNESFVAKYKRPDGNIGVKVELPYEEEKLLNDHKIILAPAYKIKFSLCSRCGNNYRHCDCIKFISDVSETVKEAEYLGMTWTTRSAYFSNEIL